MCLGKLTLDLLIVVSLCVYVALMMVEGGREGGREGGEGERKGGREGRVGHMPNMYSLACKFTWGIVHVK